MPEGIVNFYKYEIQRVTDRMLGEIELFGGKAKQIGARAANRTLQGVRTDIVHMVRKEYAVPAKDLRDKLWIKKATATSLAATLFEKGQISIPLVRYAARGKWIKANSEHFGKPVTREGVTVTVRRDSGRTLVKGGFIRQSPTFGTPQVMARVEKDQRYPLKVLYGPGYRTMLKRPDVELWIKRRADERMDQNMDRELNFLMTQWERGHV